MEARVRKWDYDPIETAGMFFARSAGRFIRILRHSCLLLAQLMTRQHCDNIYMFQYWVASIGMSLIKMNVLKH